MGNIGMAEELIGERHDLVVGDVVLLAAGPHWRADAGAPVRASVTWVGGAYVTARDDDGCEHDLRFDEHAPPEFGYDTLRPAEAFTVGSRWEGYDSGARRWRAMEVTETRPTMDLGEYGTIGPTAKFRFLDGIGYHGQALGPDDDPELGTGYLLLPAPLATVRRFRSHADLVTDAEVAAWRRGVVGAAGPTVNTAVAMLTTDDVRAGIAAVDEARGRS